MLDDFQLNSLLKLWLEFMVLLDNGAQNVTLQSGGFKSGDWGLIILLL